MNHDYLHLSLSSNDVQARHVHFSRSQWGKEIMKKKYHGRLPFFLVFWVAMTMSAIIVWVTNKDEKVSIMQKKGGSKKPTVEHIKAKHESQFLNIEGVEGVGIGEESGKPVIMVYVSERTEALQKKIPGEIEGYCVKIEVTGEFHAFDE